MTANPSPVETAREWGWRMSGHAPRWSDAKWRRINAILRIDLQGQR